MKAFRAQCVMAAAHAVLFVLCSAVGVFAPSSAGASVRQAATLPEPARPASEVLARIGRQAGVAVVADSTITERVPLPSTPATAETVEQQIAKIAQALPPGVTWVKLYLPAPRNGRSWNGDDVSAFVLAQSRLFGNAGPAPAGTVEVLGQRLAASRAGEQIAVLNLKPVYLVTNPARRAALLAEPSSTQTDPAAWERMAPEQRQRFAEQQAARLLGADPALRTGLLQQQFLIFGQMMRQMTPEQRQQFLQTLNTNQNETR